MEDAGRLAACAAAVEDADIEGIFCELRKQARQHGVGIALECQLAADAEINAASVWDSGGLIEDGCGVVRRGRGFRGEPGQRGSCGHVRMSLILCRPKYDVRACHDDIRADQRLRQDLGFPPCEIYTCWPAAGAEIAGMLEGNDDALGVALNTVPRGIFVWCAVLEAALRHCADQLID